MAQVPAEALHRQAAWVALLDAMEYGWDIDYFRKDVQLDVAEGTQEQSIADTAVQAWEQAGDLKVAMERLSGKRT